MSEKKYKKSLFIFRRDLRLEDNTALLQALEESETVVCSFIFTPTQINDNDYRSDKAVQFMLNSLDEVDKKLREKNSRLFLFYGENDEILKKLFDEGIEAVYVNKDVTPFSIKRDEAIKNLSEGSGVDFCSFDDIMFNKPEDVLKDDGKPYTVFTPFYKKAIQHTVREPRSNHFSNYYTGDVSFAENKTDLFPKILPEYSETILRSGGREEAFQVLKDRENNLHKYGELRNYPSIEGVTTLSAHNKFGTISVRELYYYIKEHIRNNEHLIREVYWRDFYLYIAYHFPKVFGDEFQEKFKDVTWENDGGHFKAWCEGRTGFPIVDAGMRELNTTGFMHNRVRMIVASFLTKDLHIDWRWGEKYFAQKLVDYDPSVNNGSWQWAASTGCDAQPYFRVFNPWLQQKKFDEKAEYIKQWVPELKDVSEKAIHNLDKERPVTLANDYPRPIVDHSEEREKAIAYYKHV